MPVSYRTEPWFEVILTITGTVWPNILPVFLCTVVYALVSYAIASWCQQNAGSEGRTILMATISFLLVFRSLKACETYADSRLLVAQFFASLHKIVLSAVVILPGGRRSRDLKRPREIRAEALRGSRVDIVRLCVALAVTLKIHTRIALSGYCFGSISRETKWRIDWERLRLRQLLPPIEFDMVDECIGIKDTTASSGGDVFGHLAQQFGQESLTYDRSRIPQSPPGDWPISFGVTRHCEARPPVVVAGLLREALWRSCSALVFDAPKIIDAAYLDDFQEMVGAALRAFEHINQVITTPIPFPYASLLHTLLTVFLLSMPFFVDYQAGIVSNAVIPSLVAFAFLGIDAISEELENPFGSDANDLDLLEPIRMLEAECLEMLRLTGDAEAVDAFCWQLVPDFVSKESSSYREVHTQLVFKELSVSSPLAQPMHQRGDRHHSSWKLWAPTGKNHMLFTSCNQWKKRRFMAKAAVKKAVEDVWDSVGRRWKLKSVVQDEVKKLWSSESSGYEQASTDANVDTQASTSSRL